jgi:antitoxin component YwqK of YwqJK toxin-antitoxin module
MISCVKKTETKSAFNPNLSTTIVELPNQTVNKSALFYNNKTSLWTLKDELYSGYALSYYPDSTLKEKIGIWNGSKQNQAIQWYPDGHYKQVANYHKGKLHGEKKGWSSDLNHVLIAQLNYHTGKAHGEQKKWYPTGELYKKLNLNMGREEGMQQAFRKNGALYANYEARAGRIFGLKKAALCYGLEDENIQYEK